MQENMHRKIKKATTFASYNKRIEFPTFHFISVLRKPRKFQYHYDDW